MKILLWGQGHRLTFCSPSLLSKSPPVPGWRGGGGQGFTLCINHAMFLNWKLEVNISNARVVVSPRFSNQSSVIKER